jgi:hypothetical protein
MNIIKREQIAAMLVAVMQADFERPNTAEMQIILDRAKSQIADIAIISELLGVPLEPSDSHPCSTTS